MLTYLVSVQQKLEAIKAANRFREITGEEPPYSADFSTNDYLALSTDSRMIEAMRFIKRTGSGGARLLGGGHREHVLLEQDIAAWLGRERALVFSSGYLAALGVIQVLSTFVETIYSDTLNHACLIDGIRASGKPREIFAHGALPARAQRKSPALIVTESLFGMDGTTVDLDAYAKDLNQSDILLVDEAHALGVFGPEGAGFARTLTDPRIVVLGTLGKAIGTAGGFIAGPAALIELLINTARTFVFDTALPPGLAFASRVGIMLAKSADDRRARLFANVAYLREALQAVKIAVPGRESPIVPILLGSEEAALAAMRRARERRVNAPAIRPPTVPPDSSRLRISVRADHSREHFDMLVDSLACTVIS